VLFLFAGHAVPIPSIMPASVGWKIGNVNSRLPLGEKRAAVVAIAQSTLPKQIIVSYSIAR